MSFYITSGTWPTLLNVSKGTSPFRPVTHHPTPPSSLASQVLRDTGVLQRIHLDTMGSPDSYTKFAKEHGMKLHSWEDRTWCLMNHYGTVRDVLKAKQ